MKKNLTISIYGDSDGPEPNMRLLLTRTLNNLGISAKVFSYNYWKIRFESEEDMNLFILSNKSLKKDIHFMYPRSGSKLGKSEAIYEWIIE